MLANALRLSLVLEVALYATLAITVGEKSPLAAVLLAVLIMLALRALLIAVTYAYAWVYRSPSARLSVGQALLMVLGEYAAFLVTFLVILPFERRWMGDDRLSPLVAPERRAKAEGSRPPILLIHGYGCSRGAWWWLRPRLEAAGWTVATISLEPIYGSIDNYVAPLARRIDEVLSETGADKLILVGHSMGGLVARAYLQSHGEVRVASLVTLGTPHQGSELARIGFGANARQMRPHSAWLLALGRPQPALAALAIYSPQDNFVMPPSLLELAGAENRTIDGLGHLAMLYSPRLALVLLTALEQRAGGGECAFAGADSEAAPDA